MKREVKQDSRVNINGAVLTDDILEKIKEFETEELAKSYCESLEILKNFFIKYLGGERPELEQMDLILILNDITYLHDFMKLLPCKIEEGAV
jgi:hypothetical protein